MGAAAAAEPTPDATRALAESITTALEGRVPAPAGHGTVGSVSVPSCAMPPNPLPRPLPPLPGGAAAETFGDGFDADDRASLLRRHAWFRWCYDRALAVTPGLSGLVTIAWTYDIDGEQVWALQEDTVGHGVATCIQAALGRVELPVEDTTCVTGDTSVTWRLAPTR
jgi:hypothetical protein